MNRVPSYVLDSMAAENIVWVGPWVVLKGPGGEIPYESLGLHTQLNAGWTFDAQLPYELDIDSIAFQTMRVIVDDGLGGVIQSPDLVALDPKAVDTDSDVAPSSSISGVDWTTFRAGRNNESFTTFRASNSQTIIQTLATRAGITVNGAPSYKVPDEDVKGSKLNDAIQRLAGAAAYEWHVDETGVMQLFPWQHVGPKLNLDWSKLERSINITKRYTKMNFGKRSAIQGNTLQGDFRFPFTEIGFKSWALPNPLIGPLVIIDRSTLGYIDWIGVWQGDPTAGGKLIDFRVLGSVAPGIMLTPLIGRYPATHMTAWIFPSAGLSGMLPGLTDTAVACALQVVGTPPSTVPVGVDPEFFYPYDTGLTPVWPAEDWVDSIFVNRAWVVAKAPYLLAMKSRGWDSLSMDAHLSASVHLRQKYTYKTHDYKVDSIGWSMPMGTDSAPTTSVGLVRI